LPTFWAALPKALAKSIQFVFRFCRMPEGHFSQTNGSMF
jgi:hypothetical protein